MPRLARPSRTMRPTSPANAGSARPAMSEISRVSRMLAMMHYNSCTIVHARGRSRQLRPHPEERPAGRAWRNGKCAPCGRPSRRIARPVIRPAFGRTCWRCFIRMRSVLTAGSASGGGLAVLLQEAMAELRDRLERHLRRLAVRDVLDARDQQHINRAMALLPRNRDLACGA